MVNKKEASSSKSVGIAARAISRSSSSSSSSNSSPAPKPASNRMCAQCQNHGLKIPVRGHKRRCKFRLCNCQNCLLVKERQRIVALHLYVRRAQQQEEDAAEAAKAAALSRNPPLQSPLLEGADLYRVAGVAAPIPDYHHSNSVAAAAVSSAYLVAEAEKQRKNIMFEELLKLRDEFQISEEAMPFLLCVLKLTGSYEEASVRIKKELNELNALPGQPGFKKSIHLSAFSSMHRPYFM
ncbi:doublesex- and mab-3-related transcription factor A2-like [Neocloeon triangulifer]|uniref:doublesex- and mab-3-related transcription factor A2-like n=1 Tax=Neocloeon triangulifer TaxID=2078957 RepID=UPI00286EC6EA|nr:doublesex- and mab-3-related transcription factor A2-like [Neocloeon triangulifer]XP_059473193.1 doublesex- and mab-3-related transcription factor A2-like [Neocloeon triangulifer]